MKIAFISNTAFNIYNFRLGLILYLQSKGYEVIYIAPKDEYVKKIAQETNASFFPLLYMSRKGYNPISDFMLVNELRNIYKKEKVDITLSFTIKPNIYSAFATYGIHTKAICNITGLGYVFLKKSIGNAIAKILFKLALKIAKIAVFQNESDKSLFINTKLCNPQKAVLINGSGINTEKYKPSSINNHPEHFIFLFIGRLLYDKGIREFVEAAFSIHKENKHIIFYIVGAMDEGNPSAISKKELDKWLLQNDSLHYFGHQTDVLPFIEDCDIVVLPSYREGLPMVLLEAMAMEKPFITSSAPGCKDLTHNKKNGLLADVGSTESLVKQMKIMLAYTKEERIEMGKYGRKLVQEKYDEKIIVQEYEKIILKLK